MVLRAALGCIGPRKHQMAAAHLWPRQVLLTQCRARQTMIEFTQGTRWGTFAWMYDAGQVFQEHAPSRQAFLPGTKA